MAFGFSEELEFRGYLFLFLPETRPRMTILVSTLIFASLHLNYDMVAMDWRLIAAVFIMGLGLAMVRWTSNGLGAGILLHGLNDAIYFIHKGGIVQWRDSPPTFGVYCWDGVAAIVSLGFFFFHPGLRAVYPAPAKILAPDEPMVISPDSNVAASEVTGADQKTVAALEANQSDSVV